MIDDELLQELLAKASGLYNNGDYRGAIAAWQEVLAADPTSQKAREGIQMATLLLVDWDPHASSSEPAPAADGAPAFPAGMRPAQRAARLDEGIARVRALLAQRKFGEAVEGARSLVPIDPDSTEVQRLVDEAQQSFEAAPFIEEHLTLAKELATEERYEEAVAECRKIFTLDPANPDGHALMQALKQRLATAAVGDTGGATMRIDRSDLAVLQGGTAPAADPGAPEAVAAEAAELIAFDDEPAPAEDDGAAAGGLPVAPALPDQMPDDLMSLDFSETGGEPSTGTADAAGPIAPDPRHQELIARAIVPPPAESREAEPFVGADLAAELGLEEEPGVAAGGIPVAAAEEPIELGEEIAPEEPAATPAPTLRFGPSSPAVPESIVPAEEDPVEAVIEEVVDAETVVAPAVRLVPRDARTPSVEQFLAEADKAESIPLAKPAAAKPSPTTYTKTPDPGWEEELESLNMQSGEHDLVGHAASRSPTVAGAADEIDLSSLLGDEMGELPAEGPPASPAPADTAAGPEPEPARTVLDEPAPSVDALLEATSPHLVMKRPPRKQERLSIPPMVFAGLGVVILAAAAGIWWFVYQPRNAAAQVAPPPSGNPPADRVEEGANGPIPTPMASTSRQPVPPEAGQADEGSVPDAEAPGTGAAAPAVAPAAAVTAAAVNPAGAAPGGGTAPAVTTPAPRPVRSAEEIRREVADRMASGRRFQAESKWREARAEYAAVLALDPVNFECKELLDQMQAKVDEDTKVRAGLEEAKNAFADKDYQGALWKLYRLPRDPRLGSIDLYIRNAWYNWAIVTLKGGDATDARQKLSETLSVDPDDADAQRLMEVAERYGSRAKDRVYYSFVDTLRYRAFDQK